MAARKPQLRSVAADEAPPPAPRKLSVSQAAESGSHRDLLVAMRERIALTVQNPDCPPRDLASLTRRLQDIAKEIESIDLLAAQERESVEAEVEDGEFDSSAV